METWGVTLWDQREALEAYTNNSIAFFDRCVSFIKERIGIEEEYARSLHRLVKQYQYKKKEDTTFSYQQCFKKFLQEHSNFANQREAISKQMSKNILNEMQAISSDSKLARKKTLRKLSECKDQIEQFRKVLFTKKKKYNEASKECSKAMTVYETASRRLCMTKSQLLKLEKYSSSKRLLAEKARKEYESSINWFNDKQKIHYEIELPDIINNEIQSREEKRTEQISGFFQEYVTIQRRLSPALSRSVAGMFDAASICDPAKDTLALIKRHQSGLPHPKNINFEDLGRTWATNQLIEKARTGKCIWSKKKEITNCSVIANKLDEMPPDDIANDYADLSPHERRKHYKEEVDNLNHLISQLEKAKDGLYKLKEATEVSGGDVLIIEEEIEANNTEIERNISLRHQYQNYIGVLSGETLSSDSFRHELIDGNENFCFLPSLDVSSAEETYEVSPISPGSVSQYLSEEFENELWYIVMYDFDERNEEELTVHAGEVVLLIDDDYDSGWSRVARGNEEGYIPTSYIRLI